MSGILIGKAYDGREGSYSLEDKGCTVIYKVRTTSPEDDHVDVGNTPGLPVIGEQHPKDPDLIVGEVLPRNDSQSRTFWLVTVVYVLPTNQGGEGLPQSQQIDPTQDAPIVKWSTEARQKAAYKGEYIISGGLFIATIPDYAIMNSAGDAFDPPPMIDDSRLSLSIQMNIPNVSSISAWLLSFKDGVNKEAFTVDGVTIPKRYAKLTRINISYNKQRNGYGYRQLEMVIHFNPDTWDLKLLDRGWRIKDPNDDTKRVAVRNDDGTAPTQPVPLDGSGNKLDDPSHDKAKYRQYRVYKDVDFNLLPFIGII